MRYILQLLLLCVMLSFAFQAKAADTITLTAKNQGYYIVSVDGADVSQHTAEREAAESAINQKLAKPGSVVEYRHDYRVAVGLVGALPPEPTATLQWDAPNVAVDGYKVHIGTASGNYSASVDVGNVLTHQVTGLKVGAVYYFAVTAYKSGAKDSGFSNEVSKQF